MSVITGQLWDQLYAVEAGHTPTPEELNTRMQALRTLDPAGAESVAVRFLVEVLTTIVQRGGPDAGLARAALIVAGPAQ